MNIGKENGMKAIVSVGSENPVKVKAVTNVFRRAFPYPLEIRPVKLTNTVDQPVGLRETQECATYRAEEVRRQFQDTTFGVGLEGGVSEPDRESNHAYLINVAAVSHESGSTGLASLFFPLPRSIYFKLVNSVYETELGLLIDELTGMKNTKQSGGAIAVFTNGLLQRQQAFEFLLTAALSPILTPNYF